MSLLDSYDDALDDALVTDDQQWADPGAVRVTDVLRQTLREEYAGASDEELDRALAEVVNAMNPAEAFNFAKGVSQIGKSAGQLLADPAVASIVRSVAPVAGGALGTVIGGPAGTALGSRLGTVAANAMPTRQAAQPAPAPAVPAVAPGVPAMPTVASPVAGGSAAAARAFFMANQRELLQGLLSTAFGQRGRQVVGGIPVAQLLGMFSQIVGQAAADADQLRYLERGGDDGESLAYGTPAAHQVLYTSLIDADHLELAEALDSDGVH
ncbi:hypothetical protein Drose_15670 [Dactylosporangium roseum]|uniref:Uncharacterized protein n=1 Tax=Dactylosporangium roseum TaxID=47989 RepID=A0ABY5ZCF2_9ACTN|nr:hypothetical protein [Dactylosporangium roseum]UWZ39542.1 hypothetical protein Drose_15670 [Dactylosporangium roseum]